MHYKSVVMLSAGEKRGFFVRGTEDSGLTVCFSELRGGIGGGSGGMESSIAGIEVSPLNVQLPWGLLARNSSSTLSWLWLWLAEGELPWGLLARNFSSTLSWLLLRGSCFQNYLQGSGEGFGKG